MKKSIILSAVLIILVSCNVNYNTRYPIRKTFPTVSGTNSRVSTAAVEREYNELLKTYKPETTEVLNDILSNSTDDPRTSITVENKSSCNMVLSINGNNYSKKIPIGAGKMGYAMVPRNQNYKLSGIVCGSTYQANKFITNSTSITLSN
ncbi:DUF6759 domain-containing protein [Chryseobacterium sp.]|uniref:DUF6759 domain-containing protein n=1 Tax=Chryseobacterium sp. TaxID=1871047 RepID=UPI0025C6E643|nr:DUF6759 domain-containing protein [Chryseobacterium sp.]